MTTPTILLLGSYNGQDSLGDECLLKSVMDHYTRAAGGQPLEFVLHAHAKPALLQQLETRGGFTANRGLQSTFWRFNTQLRHTHLPPSLRTALAALTFPGYVGGAAMLDRIEARDVLDQLARARLLHVFGGTNFSFQWFMLNAPYYFATSALLKARGRPTYLGPQQYGPMTPGQQRAFKIWLETCVTDYRARNPLCVEALGGDPATHLVADEVYSNCGLYPIERERPRNGEYILLNVRGGSLNDDSSFERSELDALAQTLASIHAALGLPFRFFAVSGAEFCHDERSYSELVSRIGGRVPLENCGRVADEHELMTLAGRAYGCISMSFHGCILSGFRGIPMIPVTTDRYYDYKYAGFDRYGDGRPIPLLSLSRPASSEEVAAVVSYLRDFDAAAAARLREQAAERVDAYYRGIVEREL